MVAGIADVGEVADAAHVDEHRRRGEAQLHERQERMPAGQQLGLVAVLAEQADGLLGRAGPDVVELGRNHYGFPPVVDGLAEVPEPLGRNAASADGVPLAAPAPLMAAHTRSGEAGMSMSRMPNGCSASMTAFMTAGVDAMVPASPMPFTPIGLVGLGVVVWSVMKLGDSAAVGTR